MRDAFSVPIRGQQREAPRLFRSPVSQGQTFVLMRLQNSARKADFAGRAAHVN
jgi:hypothetical protein